MGREMGNPRCPANGPASGFNEARPNWAGKCRGSSPGRSRGARFNEARPNWAGKCQGSAGEGSRYSLASMRPGPIGPGNLGILLSRPRAHRASMRPGPIGPGNTAAGGRWSPVPAGFNEARPNWAGKSAAYRRGALGGRASMRPGPIGPGNMAVSTGTSEAGRASMRPGPIGPGNRRRHSFRARAARASMRPGPIGPGNLACKRSGPGISLSLQ